MADIQLVKTCPVCGTKQLLIVDETAYKAWLDGKMLIQDAFPDLSVDDREILKTGICRTCWDEMFKNQEDDDG